MRGLNHLLALPGCFAPDPAQTRSAIWLRTLATKSLATLVTVFLFATAVFAEAPELSTDKDAYAPNEPIKVTFRNSPGNSNDWIALATQATPDGQYQQWQWIRTTEGSVTFQGLDEGVDLPPRIRAIQKEILFL